MADLIHGVRVFFEFWLEQPSHPLHALCVVFLHSLSPGLWRRSAVFDGNHIIMVIAGCQQKKHHYDAISLVNGAKTLESLDFFMRYTDHSGMGKLSGHNRTKADPVLRRAGIACIRQRRAAEAFAEANLDPLRECIKLAKACKHAETRWARMFALIPYLYPKLQSVQVSDDPDAPLGGGLVESITAAVQRARQLAESPDTPDDTVADADE